MTNVLYLTAFILRRLWANSCNCCQKNPPLCFFIYTTVKLFTPPHTVQKQLTKVNSPN